MDSSESIDQITGSPYHLIDELINRNLYYEVFPSELIQPNHYAFTFRKHYDFLTDTEHRATYIFVSPYHDLVNPFAEYTANPPEAVHSNYLNFILRNEKEKGKAFIRRLLIEAQRETFGYVYCMYA